MLGEEGQPVWRRRIPGILSILALAYVVHFFSASFPARQQGADFPDFYAAARIVLQGDGHQLYDRQTQELFQEQCCGRMGTYFYHPAYETLIYLPGALFSLKAAYTLWCGMNAGLLALFSVLLSRSVLKRWRWPLLALLPLLFPSVMLNFFQGQDSLLLLVLATSSILALRRNSDLSAGCLLACGLFKFHLLLTLVLMLFCLRRTRALSAFAGGALGLLAACVGICGPHFVTSYRGFLNEISGLPLNGIHPDQMANLRGLVALCGIGGSAGFIVIIVLSITTVLVPAWLCFGSGRTSGNHLDLIVAAFWLAAPLVSYHLSPHDLSFLLFPLALIVQHLLVTPAMPAPLRNCMIASAAFLFLPPLHIILSACHLYSLTSIPLIILFVCACLELRRATRILPQYD